MEQKKVQKRGIKWRFYKYIVKFNGQYTNENFTEEAVFKGLFGKHEDFVQSKISKLKKEFLQLLDSFLSSQNLYKKNSKNEKGIEEGERDLGLKVQHRLDMFLYYTNRFKASEIWIYAYEALEDSLQNYPYKGEFYHQMRYELNNCARILKSRMKVKLSEDPFEEVLKYLDDYYLISILKIVAQDRNRQILHLSNLSNLSKPPKLEIEIKIEEIRKLPIEETLKKEGISTWYLAVLFLLPNPSNKPSFSEINQHLDQHIEDLPKSEARILSTFLENFLGMDREILKGKKRYEALYRIYQLQLKKHIIQETQSLTYRLFNNIVTVALRLVSASENDEEKNYYIEGAEHFISQYFDKIVIGESGEEKKIQQKIKPYNEASLFLAKKDVKKAWGIIKKFKLKPKLGAKHPDALFKLAIDRLVLKVAYELKEAEEFLNSCNRIGVYVNKKDSSLSQATVKAHQTLITIAQNLFKQAVLFKRNRKKHKIKNLIEETKATQLVYEKDWLLQKGLELF
ncbi:MAG: hypothetical protein ACPG49_06475 [Chitinophagales bacterium]